MLPSASALLEDTGPETTLVSITLTFYRPLQTNTFGSCGGRDVVHHFFHNDRFEFAALWSMTPLRIPTVLLLCDRSPASAATPRSATSRNSAARSLIDLRTPMIGKQRQQLCGRLLRVLLLCGRPLRVLLRRRRALPTILSASSRPRVALPPLCSKNFIRTLRSVSSKSFAQWCREEHLCNLTSPITIIYSLLVVADNPHLHAR